MKIKKISLNVILCLVSSAWIVESWDISLMSKGPKPGETGKYIYTEDGVTFKHCLYCDIAKAFYNDTENMRHQEYRCGDKYSNLLSEITSYERDNKLYPVCKIGTTPGCGPPPEVQKGVDDKWICDLGYSNVNYSVYFSCYLVNRHTHSVKWSYYCNESLRWDEVSFVTVRPSYEMITGESKRDGTEYTAVLIAVGVFLVLLVFLLVVAIIYICSKRTNQDIDCSHDPEANSALMKVNLTSPSNNDASSPSNDSSTGSNITVSTDDGDKPDVSGTSLVERLPPYGEEGSKSMGCQTSICFRPQNIYMDGQVHKEPHSGVRAEFQNSLTSDLRVHQCALPSSHVLDKSPNVNADNNKSKHEGTNNLNKPNRNFRPVEILKNERPNPLGNISNIKCSDIGLFDDEEDNRHNTELKQRFNERVSECKKSNKCCHKSQHFHGEKNVDISLQSTSQCTCTQLYQSQCHSVCACAQQSESQCPLQCAFQSFEKANEMLDRAQISYNYKDESDDDSFEIQTCDLTPQTEFDT